ncbi:MAG: hypothetical protein ACOX7W_03215 [Christensenellales bacterium]|jgi:hypothetical protein
MMPTESRVRRMTSVRTDRRRSGGLLSRALLLAALIVLQIPAAAAARYSGARYMALAISEMRIRSGRIPRHLFARFRVFQT